MEEQATLGRKVSSRALSCYQKKWVFWSSSFVFSSSEQAAMWMVMLISNSELAVVFVLRTLSTINIRGGTNLKSTWYLSGAVPMQCCLSSAAWRDDFKK